MEGSAEARESVKTRDHAVDGLGNIWRESLGRAIVTSSARFLQRDRSVSWAVWPPQEADDARREARKGVTSWSTNLSIQLDASSSPTCESSSWWDWRFKYGAYEANVGRRCSKKICFPVRCSREQLVPQLVQDSGMTRCLEPSAKDQFNRTQSRARAGIIQSVFKRRLVPLDKPLTRFYRALARLRPHSNQFGPRVGAIAAEARLAPSVL